MATRQSMNLFARAALALIGLVWGAAAAVLIWSAPAHASGPFSGRVIGIADGDTLTVLADYAQHKIRLAEIDAPEKKQAFGEEARLSLYQVSHGLAWAYIAYLTDPDIAAAEQLARDSGLGLWADAEPTPPWLYRKGKHQ